MNVSMDPLTPLTDPEVEHLHRLLRTRVVPSRSHPSGTRKLTAREVGRYRARLRHEEARRAAEARKKRAANGELATSEDGRRYDAARAEHREAKATLARARGQLKARTDELEALREEVNEVAAFHAVGSVPDKEYEAVRARFADARNERDALVDETATLARVVELREQEVEEAKAALALRFKKLAAPLAKAQADLLRQAQAKGEAFERLRSDYSLISGGEDVGLTPEEETANRHIDLARQRAEAFVEDAA